MKQRHEPVLQLRVQIDQQVAAGDQVELGEGRILDQVLHGEDGHLADVLADAIGAVVAGEVALQTLRRDIAGNALRVAAVARRFDGVVVQVRAEQLHVAVALGGLQVFAHEDRQRVQLLAGGTARHPDAQGAIVRA